MGVPVIMVVLAAFSVIARFNLLSSTWSNRFVLVFLYIGINAIYNHLPHDLLQQYFKNVRGSCHDRRLHAFRGFLESHFPDGADRYRYSNHL